jgi:hypothetical protein
MPLTEAVSSIDNWSGRKVLAELCREVGLPWWSAGSSFLGGFSRRIDSKNDRCASAWEGVEQLGERDDDDDGDSDSSCSAASTPMPSSVLPQMVIGSWIAANRRELLLGRPVDAVALARGIEVHLNHGSEQPGYEGLLWSPGRRTNVKSPGGY